MPHHDLTRKARARKGEQPLLDLGAVRAFNLSDLVADTDIVITMLTDEKALEDVYLGASGLLSSAVAGKLFVDMSTVKPSMAKAVGARVLAAQASYLECPVGGSVGPASEGKLLGFVGGAGGDLERARPILEQLCRRLEHVGDLGSGATMKLAINLPLMVYWQTLGEALSLIQPLGLDPKRVIDIFSETSGGPNMLKVRGGMIAQALSGTQSNLVTVDVATMRKDLRSMLDQASTNNVSLPLTAQTLKNFDQAAVKGLDTADCTQLLVWWLNEGGKPEFTA